MKNPVTICVINYKTLELTKLCLRSIRKYTNYPYQVMVVDNDSQDESTQYLKSLKWIRLIERKKETSSGGYEHAAALDLGLRSCDTEFFMSLHSDTFVHRDNWLTDLMSYFTPQTACVGSDKVDMAPQWQIWLKKTTDFRTFKRILLKTPDPLGVYRYYNRTVCSIYRKDVLDKEGLTFMMGREQGLTAGKKLYFELVDRGYNTVELADPVMKKYVWHLAHATQVVNSDEFKLRDKTIRKTSGLIKNILNCPQVQDILADKELDK